MRSIKYAVFTTVGFFMTMQQVFAQALPNEDPGVAVPEIDGSGAIIAIGLVAGLVALFREKYFRK